MEREGIKPKKIIAVQKPAMERRTYAAIRKQWPEVELTLTSPQLSYEEYLKTVISKEKMINQIVGDLQRIKIYPERGLQIPQEVPADVWAAYEKLVSLGFGKVLTD